MQLWIQRQLWNVQPSWSSYCLPLLCHSCSSLYSSFWAFPLPPLIYLLLFVLPSSFSSFFYLPLFSSLSFFCFPLSLSLSSSTFLYSLFIQPSPSPFLLYPPFFSSSPPTHLYSASVSSILPYPSKLPPFPFSPLPSSLPPLSSMPLIRTFRSPLYFRPVTATRRQGRIAPNITINEASAGIPRRRVHSWVRPSAGQKGRRVRAEWGE